MYVYTHSASRTLTACAAVLVATLVVSAHPGTLTGNNEPVFDDGYVLDMSEHLDNPIVNSKRSESELEHDVMPVTSQHVNKRIINGNEAVTSQHVNKRIINGNEAVTSQQVNKRIINGNEAVRGSHPYIAELRYRKRHHCGGTLIHERWVLTAAHCVYRFYLMYTRGWRINYRSLDVALGQHDRTRVTGPEQFRRVKTVIVHPDYRHGAGLSHDIALIHLDKPVKSSKYIKKATLAKDDSAFVNTDCVVAGWGGMAPGGPTPRALQEAHTTLIPNDRCIQGYNNPSYIRYVAKCQKTSQCTNINPIYPQTDGVRVCTYDVRRTDKRRSFYRGDSGGPLTCGRDHDVIVGVVSLARDNRKPELQPQFYARVSVYIDWIRTKTGVDV